jgi:hypothetical protein
MTEHQHLAMEVNYVYRAVGQLEPMSTKFVESNTEVRQWAEALSRGEG